MYIHVVAFTLSKSGIGQSGIIGVMAKIQTDSFSVEIVIQLYIWY